MTSAAYQKTLHTYGFHWDGPVIFQSERCDTYRQRLLQLNEKHKLYLCSCSRRDLGSKRIYPNNCKPVSNKPNSHANVASDVVAKLTNSGIQKAIRVAIDTNVAFKDLIQGEQFVEVGTGLCNRRC